MNIRVKITFLLAAVLICAGSGGLMPAAFGQTAAADSDNVTVRKNQNGEEIAVKPGAIIRVELPALGSAGYTWHIDNLQTEYIDLLGEESKVVDAGERLGAPVMQIWRFRAKRTGDVEIKLDYYRQWEGKGKTAEHFYIRLHISDKGKQEGEP